MMAIKRVSKPIERKDANSNGTVTYVEPTIASKAVE